MPTKFHAKACHKIPRKNINIFREQKTRQKYVQQQKKLRKPKSVLYQTKRLQKIESRRKKIALSPYFSSSKSVLQSNEREKKGEEQSCLILRIIPLTNTESDIVCVFCFLLDSLLGFAFFSFFPETS